MSTKKVLVVSDQPQMDQAILSVLEASSFVGIRKSDLPENVSELSSYALLLLVCSHEGTWDVRRAIESFVSLKRSTTLVPPTIVVLAEEHLSLGIIFIKEGRTDFILKPVNPVELEARIERLLQEERSRHELNMAKLQRMGTVQFVNLLTAQQLLMLEDIANMEISLRALLPDICKLSHKQVVEQGCLAIKELTALCRQLKTASEKDSAQWYYVMEELRDQFRAHPWKCQK